MNKFFKNVKNIVKSIFKKVNFQRATEIIQSINEKYKKCCEKNKELPSILTIGLSTIFVVSLVLILKSTINTKEEVVTPASVTVNIVKNSGEESFYLGEYDKAIEEYEKLDKNEEWPI